jgi:signal peptidase II
LEYLSFGESRAIFPGFNLTLVFNTGISFGIGQNLNSAFKVIASVLVCVLIFMWVRWPLKERVARFSFALICAGALGNLIDRFRYGAVVDFLDFYINVYHWPAFNIADSAICIGVTLLFIQQWTGTTLWRDEKK